MSHQQIRDKNTKASRLSSSRTDKKKRKIQLVCPGPPLTIHSKLGFPAVIGKSPTSTVRAEMVFTLYKWTFLPVILVALKMADWLPLNLAE